VGSYLAHGPEIYPKAHENPRAFSCIFGPIFLESSIQCPWGVGLHQINNLKQEVKELRQLQEIHQIILSPFEEQSDSEKEEKR